MTYTTICVSYHFCESLFTPDYDLRHAHRDECSVIPPPLQGGKSNPVECSEDYGGPSPASEPETQNIMNYWKSNGPIVGAIDWHSYGQLILRPWGKSSPSSAVVCDYSRTSDKGPSEIGTNFLQRTLVSTPC